MKSHFDSYPSKDKLYTDSKGLQYNGSVSVNKFVHDYQDVFMRLKESDYDFYAKAKYGIESPENATSQNILYVVCAAFTTDVYQEAFGMIDDTILAKQIYNNNVLLTIVF